MPSVDMNASSSICRKCGRAYGRLKGYFPVSHSDLCKGVGYLPYCRECVDKIYDGFLSGAPSDKDAVRATCRKLNIYWNSKIYDSVAKLSASRTMMTSYMVKANNATYAGKSYDDTLREEGTFWKWDESDVEKIAEPETEPEEDEFEVSEEVKSFWGPGYTSKMYMELEQRHDYWIGKFPQGFQFDLGTEALLRQVIILEITINEDRAAGKNVDKSVTTLNTLLGSLNLKPTQLKDDNDSQFESTPFGVWIKKIEDKRPVSDPDPEFRDVDGIIKYITTWFLGHLGKMLGIRNSYTKLYEDELSKYVVNNPQFEEEDDETLFNDIFSSVGGDSA